MELTVKRGDFLNELTLMQGVVERKNTIPILSNILLKAADGHLSLTSTDLDLTLLSQADAKVSRSGSVTVPARKLFDLIRNLPEAEVSLKLMDIDSESFGIPATTYHCVVKMPSTEFQRICKELAVIGETVTVHVSVAGHARSYSFTIAQPDAIKYVAPAAAAASKPSVTSVFFMSRVLGGRDAQYSPMLPQWPCKPCSRPASISPGFRPLTR